MAAAAAAGLVLSLLTAGPAWAQGESFQVDTTADTVDAAVGDGRCADDAGRCSLRAAVQEAGAAGGGEIGLRRATYRLTLAGEGEDGGATGDLDVASRITVDGGGARVDAGGLDRAFHVSAGASLTLAAVTVTGGVADGAGNPANSGGGVLNQGTLIVERSTITSNSAVRAGGGIEATAGTVTRIERSTLSGNETGPAPGNGGGLHITSAAGQGGTVTVDRSVVTGNTAAQEGGGLWNDAGSRMTVARTVLTGNGADGAKADDGGGALFNNGGRLSVDRSEIRDNTADVGSGSGGGVFTLGGVLTVERSDLRGNTAARAGGGIEANLGVTTLSRTTLSGNGTGPTPGNGGGLHLTGAGTVTIDRGTVARNSATNEGGGLWNAAGGTMTVTRTAIRDNTAPVGPNVFQQPPDGDLTVDGEQVPPGPNDL